MFKIKYLFGPLCFGLTFILLCFLLFQQKEYMEYDILETKVVEVQFLRVASRPKHFRIDFLDKERNETIENYYVSKHFSDWNKIPQNSIFEVTREKIKYVNRENQPEVYCYSRVRTGLEKMLDKAEQ